MVARGHDVWLAAPVDSPIAKNAAARGLRVVPVRFRRPWGVRDVPIVRRTICRLGVEVVNTHSSWDAWIAGMAARLAGTAVGLVRTRHVSTPIASSPASRFLYTRLADRVVTTGETIRQAMIQRNGYPAGRIVSVATGLDLAAFRPTRDSVAVRASLGIPADVWVVGTVSTLRSWKGHRYLVEAIASLRSERDVRGLLVGDGPYAEAIRSRILELGLEAAVTMPGQREDVADMLTAMDVFAFPSTANEGVPQAVLQAMALRRPVVASRIGGIPEVVRDGETGLLVPAGDAAALARGIGRVRADTSAAVARSRAAEGLVRAEYTLEVMLEKMEQVYRAALDPWATNSGVAERAGDGRFGRRSIP